MAVRRELRFLLDTELEAEAKTGLNFASGLSEYYASPEGADPLSADEIERLGADSVTARYLAAEDPKSQIAAAVEAKSNEIAARAAARGADRRQISEIRLEAARMLKRIVSLPSPGCDPPVQKSSDNFFPLILGALSRMRQSGYGETVRVAVAGLVDMDETMGFGELDGAMDIVNASIAHNHWLSLAEHAEKIGSMISRGTGGNAADPMLQPATSTIITQVQTRRGVRLARALVESTYGDELTNDMAAMCEINPALATTLHDPMDMGDDDILEAIAKLLKGPRRLAGRCALLSRAIRGPWQLGDGQIYATRDIAVWRGNHAWVTISHEELKEVVDRCREIYANLLLIADADGSAGRYSSAITGVLNHVKGGHAPYGYQEQQRKWELDAKSHAVENILHPTREVLDPMWADAAAARPDSVNEVEWS